MRTGARGKVARKKSSPGAKDVRVTAHVHLWGQVVGQVTEYENGRIGFTYDKTYIPKGPCISPKYLPLENRVFEFPELRSLDSFLGLPGVLADSLPDAFGNKIIQNYFDSRGEPAKAMSPVQRLLYVGKRAMGALEYTPSLQLENANRRVWFSQFSNYFVARLRRCAFATTSI